MNKNYEFNVLLVVTEEHDFRDTANCKLVSLKRRLGLPNLTIGASFLTQKVELLEEGKSVSHNFSTLGSSQRIHHAM